MRRNLILSVTPEFKDDYNDVIEDLILEDLQFSQFSDVSYETDLHGHPGVSMAIDTDETWDSYSDEEVVSQLKQGALIGVDFMKLEKLNW